MANETQAPHIADPRNSVDFTPSLYPRVNGEDPPETVVEQNDKVRVDFAGIYYAINSAYVQLHALQGKSDIDRNEERRRLQAVEKLLIARDELEDYYAPFGVIAEPLTEAGVTVDIDLSFGNVDAAGRLRSDDYTITAYMPVPLPPGTRFEQLPIFVEGPGL